MTLEIELTPYHTEILSGGACPVTWVVRNLSKTNPVRIPNRNARSPVTYQLTSVRSDGPHYTFSNQRYRAALSTSAKAGYSPPLMELGPEQGMFFEEDIGAYLLEPIRPGTYDVVAEYSFQGNVYRSLPVEIRVLPFHISQWQQTISLSGQKLSTVFAHATQDGETWLYQRRSERLRPELGMPHQRQKIPKEASCSQMVLAVETRASQEWRWVVWLQAGTLHGIIGWGKQNMATLLPYNTRLDSPVLIHPGWQFDDGTALFLVAGIQKGTAKLKIISIRATDEVESKTINLKLAQVPENFRTCFHRDSSPFLQLVWSDVKSNRSRLRTLTFDPFQPKNLKPKTLFTHPGSLLTFEMSAVQNGDSGWVDALFQTGKTAEPLCYVRIPYGSVVKSSGAAGKPVQWRIPWPSWFSQQILVGKIPERVFSWHLTNPLRTDAPILAHTPDRLLYTYAVWHPMLTNEQGDPEHERSIQRQNHPDSEQNTLEPIEDRSDETDNKWLVAEGNFEGISQVEWGHFQTPLGLGQGPLWATWIDPELGFQWKPIPSP